MQALISVSDKTGVVELARELARARRQAALDRRHRASCSPTPASPVTEVAEHTGFPGDARRPRQDAAPDDPRRPARAARQRRAHGGARRSTASRTIDLLVVNLYPFEATVAKAGCTLADAIENIDIGGPAMVRSAAKNWKDVAVLTDASQYAGVARRAEARRQGQRGDALRARRRRLRPHRPATTARSATTCRRSPARATASPSAHEFPAQANGRFVKLQDLRYGENPHQRAAFYRDLAAGARLARHGEAAAGQGALVQQHRRRRRGVGVRQELRRAGVRDRQARQPVRRRRRRRLRPRPTPRRCKTDPTSAFGGIIAFNARGRPRLRRARRQAVRRGADRAVVQRRGARRLRGQGERARAADRPAGARRRPQRARPQARRLGPPDPDRRQPRASRASDLKVVTTRQPTPAQMSDLLFAWKVAQVRQEQRDRLLRRRHDARRRRRPDEPHRLGAHRRDQGRGGAASRSPARRWRATPSSRSATASTSSSTPARPASSSRAARCATTR